MGVTADVDCDTCATGTETEAEHISTSMQDSAHLASLRADPDDPHDPSGQSAEDLQDDWEEESALRELESERGAKSDREAAEEERQGGAR
eukprot:3798168-Rhodomonas_salina.1